MNKFILKRVFNRVLSLLARFLPGSESVRPLLHRARGVQIKGRVFIGEDVLIETEYPECVELRDGVTISMRAIVIAHTRGIGKVVLGEKCFIGPNSVIVCSGGKELIIGEEAVIAAGSVVTRSVPPLTMVAPPASLPVAKLEVPLTLEASMEQFLAGMKALRPTDRRK